MTIRSGGKSAPQCPFCGADIRRPEEIAVSDFEQTPGGTCTCGAIYLADPTGKNVGTIMAQALGMAANALEKDVHELVAEQDYRDAVLSYDWRTHRSIGVNEGFMDGYGRLYVIKVNKKAG